MRNKWARGIVLLGVLVMLNLSGCATSSSGKYRGANLSDAAKQASGKNAPIPRAEHSHSHGGRLSSQVYRDHSYRSSMDVAIGADVAVAVSGNGFGFEYSHIRYSSSSLEEGSFYSLYTENLDDDRTEAFGGKLVIGDYTLPATGIVGDSIISAHSWGLEGFVKYYGPDIAMVTAPYFLMAIGYGDLHWTYRQPITDSSGYTFSTDSLEYMEFKAGVGGELGRYGVLQLSAYAGPVARLYMGRTREGFNNDLFEHRLDMTWGATVGLRF